MAKHFQKIIYLLIFLIPALVYGVDFQPQVKARLISQGKMKSMVLQYNQARLLGLDQPVKKQKLSFNKLMAGAGNGTIKGLFILVDFPDQIADSVNHSPAAFEELLFSAGTYPTGSMNDFYLENSNGKMGITGTVTPWLRMPHPYSYYTNGEAGFGEYPRNAQGLAEDAVSAADSLIDFSQFDGDGDGYVDALFIVHAGPGRETTGSNDDIHSHAWEIPPQNRDDVWLKQYTMEPETQDGHLVTMGVFAHEFGHILGLPDLYDVDYSSKGIGNWSVMSGGSWGGPDNLRGSRPVHFDAWCKQKLAWLNPVHLSADSLNVLIPPIEGGEKAYRLWTNGESGNEYFLLENRRKEGFDSFLPGAGLLVWHIDESVPGNAVDWHRKVDLVQADGLFNLNSSPADNGNAGDAGDPFPGTSGNSTFNGQTVPSSHGYVNQETLVGVMNIADTPQGILSDLYVSYPVPLVNDVRILVNDSLGDNQGDLDPGEHVWLTIELLNSGASLPNAEISISSSQNTIDPSNSTVSLASIPPDTSKVRNVFEFTVNPDVQNPSYVLFNIEVHNSSFDRTYQKILTIGDQTGFSSGMEEDSWIWTHYAVTPDYSDQWNISPARNYSPDGSQAYKLGPDSAGGTYSSGLYAALETPWIKMEPGMVLEFSTWYDMEASNLSGEAFDGGLIQMTRDGVHYQQLTPSEGYSHRIIYSPESPFEKDTPVFSGNSGGWLTYHVNLPDSAGQGRIRFVFGSDAAVGGAGWYIDDVSVTSMTGLPQNHPAAVASGFGIIGNYPNPFNPATTIRFMLENNSGVTLNIYNVAGQKVRTLPAGNLSAGLNEVKWDGRSDDNQALGSGFYIAVLQQDNRQSVRKLILVK
ncbi:MAG: M6 family metalloprotease domain-containing protein [Calditrichia bacterium]